MVPADLQECLRQIVLRYDKLRLQFHRLPKLRDGSIEIIRPEESDAQVVVGFCVTWHEPQCFAELFNGLL